MAYSPHPFNVTNWTVFLVALYQTKVSLALGNPHERRQRSCNSKEKLLQPWSDLLEFLRRSPPNKPLMFVWNWVDIHEIRCFLFGNLLWNSGKARHDACGKTKGLKKYSLRFCVCVCAFFFGWFTMGFSVQMSPEKQIHATSCNILQPLLIHHLVSWSHLKQFPSNLFQISELLLTPGGPTLNRKPATMGSEEGKVHLFCFAKKMQSQNDDSLNGYASKWWNLPKKCSEHMWQHPTPPTNLQTLCEHSTDCKIMSFPLKHDKINSIFNQDLDS